MTDTDKRVPFEGMEHLVPGMRERKERQDAFAKKVFEALAHTDTDKAIKSSGSKLSNTSFDSTDKAEQRVVCAANRNRATGLIICGARHFDQIMHRQMEARPPEERDDWRRSEQGFIDQFGTFLTREEAHKICTERGQFFRRFGGDEKELYSENLY